jgi:hypothetical protein
VRAGITRRVETTSVVSDHAQLDSGRPDVASLAKLKLRIGFKNWFSLLPARGEPFAKKFKTLNVSYHNLSTEHLQGWKLKTRRFASCTAEVRFACDEVNDKKIGRRYHLGKASKRNRSAILIYSEMIVGTDNRADTEFNT